MRYGRTTFEVMVAQALLLTAFLVAPFNLIEVIGTIGAGVVAMTIAAAVASVLFMRHRSRNAAYSALERKIEALRRVPVA